VAEVTLFTFRRLGTMIRFARGGADMQQEQEVRKLMDELEKLTGFISEYGTGQEFEQDPLPFAMNVCDALSWAVGDVTTEGFMSDGYLKHAMPSSNCRHDRETDRRRPGEL